jgi:hypothetical protein
MEVILSPEKEAKLQHFARRTGRQPSQLVVEAVAEIETSLISRQCLGTRRIPQLDLLANRINSWNAKVNHQRNCIHWKFSRKAARIKLDYKRSTSRRSTT